MQLLFKLQFWLPSYTHISPYPRVVTLQRNVLTVHLFLFCYGMFPMYDGFEKGQSNDLIEIDGLLISRYFSNNSDLLTAAMRGKKNTTVIIALYHFT